MGLKLFSSDIINVHDYEKRASDGQYLYRAYYEYFVSQKPDSRGFHRWKAIIYDRYEVGLVLEEGSADGSSVAQARRDAQEWIRKRMEKYNRSKQ